MKIYRDTLLCALLLLTIAVSQAFPVAFEERKPRDEKIVQVPRGARPMLKEEYPRKQLVVDRIRARHKPALIIPFVRAWNTASLTALGGMEMEEQTDIDPGEFELGFALHSQRMRVGAVQNREYFQRETAGFPEGRYRPLKEIDDIGRSKGYMATTFMHLAAKRLRRKYTDYLDFTDRINGILNAITTKDKQVTFTAERDMHDLRTEGSSTQPRVKNIVGISYKKPGKDVNKLELHASSIWSTLTDAEQRDFRYISGLGTAVWGRSLNSDVDMDLKGKFQVSTIRDQTNATSGDPWDVRKSGWLDVIGVISLAESLKLKLNVSSLYDSQYKFYFTPAAELVLSWSALKAGVGGRRLAILPDHDDIYWPSKSVKVNDDLKAEDFWEAFGSLEVNVIARLILLAEASYSRPESRITWEQLPGYVWEPKNVETSDALKGKASIKLNLIGSLDTFASCEYQRFDNQRFDPEIVATGGFSYGNPIRGAITLGASFWTFQPLENMDSRENFSLVYGHINKSIRRVFSLFIDGQYTFNDESILYYRGMPQAGRIVSVGVNIVFGGLE